MREEPSFLPSGRRRQQEAVEVLQQLLAVASVDRLSFLVWTVREPVCDLPVSDVAAPVELQGRPATTEPAFAEQIGRAHV